MADIDAGDDDAGLREPLLAPDEGPPPQQRAAGAGAGGEAAGYYGAPSAGGLGAAAADGVDPFGALGASGHAGGGGVAGGSDVEAGGLGGGGGSPGGGGGGAAAEELPHGDDDVFKVRHCGCGCGCVFSVRLCGCADVRMCGRVQCAASCGDWRGLKGRGSDTRHNTTNHNNHQQPSPIKTHQSNHIASHPQMRELIDEKPRDVLQYIEEQGVLKVCEFEVEVRARAGDSSPAAFWCTCVDERGWRLQHAQSSSRHHHHFNLPLHHPHPTHTRPPTTSFTAGRARVPRVPRRADPHRGGGPL